MLPRTCVLEMHSAKEKGILKGDSDKSRFDFFIKALCEKDNCTALFQKYSALNKNINDLIEQTLRTTKQFILRLAKDFNEISRTFFKREANFRLDFIDASGDRHCSGERVLILHFKDSNGKIHKLLYKPRSLKIDIAFQKFLNWVNKKTNFDFYIMTILDKKDYGWSEFIAHKTCKTKKEFNEFYYELGGLLGITYILNGLDIHSENIIAHGTHPVIVDYECYLPPSLETFNFRSCRPSSYGFK